MTGTTPINELVRVDFGGGADEFFNGFGGYSFNVSLFDYRGFNSFYNLDNDRLAIKQTADSGDILLDNNGPDDAIRTSINGAPFAFHTPVTDLRFHAKADAPSDLVVDFDHSHAGDLAFKLRRGLREVSFTGDANEFLGDLRVSASEGQQLLKLAENSSLRVGGNAFINLRGDVDTIEDAGRTIQVNGNLSLRNVNEFEVTGALNVDGDVKSFTFTETDDSVFESHGSISIGGDFLYFGGQQADALIFDGMTDIAGAVYVHLGANDSLADVQQVAFSVNTVIAEQVNVLSGPTETSVFFDSDSAAIFGDRLFVNFEETSGNNLIDLGGRIDGNLGGIRGGSGNENVRLGIQAVDMAFSALLGNGMDEMEIDFDTELLTGHLDFGNGDDTLLDNSNLELELSIINL